METMKNGTMCRRVIPAFVTAMMALPAFAEDSDLAFGLGGSRASGMANVGVALPYIIGAQGKFNPAFYGFASKKFRLNSPSFGLKLQGIDIGDINDILKNVRDGGLDAAGAQTLARLLQQDQIEAGVLFDFGFGGGNFDFSIDGQVGASALPNKATRAYSGAFGQFIGKINTQDATDLANAILNINNNNVQGDLNAIINDPKYQAIFQQVPELLNNLTQAGVTVDGRTFQNAAGIDTYGYGFYSANISYGFKLQTKGEADLSIGARGKIVNAYYTHLIVNSSNNNNVVNAPEMGADNVLKKSGFGMDLGVIYSFGVERNNHVGLSIENFIRPSVGISGTGPLGDNPVFDNNGNLVNAGQKEILPFKTLVSLGYGMKRGKFLAGADWYDIGNANRQGELRLGAEYMLSPAFGLRAGYGSKTKFCFGATIFGIAITFAENLPATVSAAFKF